MRAYTAFLNKYPLVVPAAIFVGASWLLLPYLGPYSFLVAVLAAAKLTETW